MDAGLGLDNIKSLTNQVSASIRDIARLIDDKAEPAVEVELSTGKKIIPGLNMHHDAESLYGRAKSIDEGLFTILVLGMFSNGKSTLLNAMLGKKELPAGATPTTGLITLLVYGNSELVKIYEHGKNEPRQLTREEFLNEYRLQTQDANELNDYRFSNVRYARMETMFRICAQGVRIVDSPGLGEHLSRSELTESFLKKADALIFVLDAHRLLDKLERDFISEHCGQNRLEHAFFTVNRINHIEDDEDKTRLSERAHKILSKYFCDAKGNFDKDLYQRRIFWINALGAFKARQTSPPDEAALKRSGVMTFEKELEAFLTDEQRFKAQLKTTIQVIEKMLPQVYAHIQRQKVTLGQPLKELIERTNSVSQKLNELEKRCQDIQLVITEACEKVQLKLEIDLTNFVDGMIADWENDLPGMVEELSDITFGDVALGGFYKIRQKKISEIVHKTIEGYVKQKFENWSTQATEIIREDVDELRQKLSARMDEFVFKLSEARREFSGDETVYPRETQDLAISISTKIFFGGAGLMGVLMGTVRRAFLIWLLVGIAYLTPFGWGTLIGVLLYDVLTASFQGEKLKHEMLDRLGKQLHKNLRNELRTDDLTPAVFARFVDFLNILKTHQKPLDRFIWKNLSGETISVIKKFKPDKIAEDSKQAEDDSKKASEIAQILATDLTRLTHQTLYSQKRFTGIDLPDETKRLLETDPKGKELALLNRYLLVAAYPDHLAPKLRDVVYREVKSEFVKVSNNLSADLSAQINQLRGQMEATLKDKKKEEFSAKQEQERLDRVGEQVLQSFNKIRKIAGYQDLTLNALLMSQQQND